MSTIQLSDTGIVSPQPAYATRQWLLERLHAIQNHAARIRAMARQAQTDASGNPAESFNSQQFAAVVAVREVGRRNGNYRGESFDAEQFGLVMAERERRRLTGDDL